ncbi:hypothetical protein WICANDRAFT_29068 [Wickerhamomyces anomalus NRRL Y-366-8]|uniref:Hsp90 chaperone protein kinase-targeting subunit n=1 Tax=Wickerhamomyces anomalus (strain ATCC 58044 / CBS 1984 / NCYC 433 / NRRL Y-366-8) TaxID=683960 RepID=A0A1E3P5Z7_WICAA|nr:uncharacterized protein WICANDRAFT_29068 [Wickerhamomyces anomalus NRRL Y-366-8]ODQ60748.1 hypothetical protein WICANDRAFT_29068 [Wickerhamomyces anomalus NRRL Y-366-8]
MAIDYSKWDKLELSDDSDVEVHPNVDKNSFIRWRQQDIHMKRQQREQDIKTLETQRDMYSELNKRTDQLLSDVGTTKLADFDYVKTYLAEHFDPNSKPLFYDEQAAIDDINANSGNEELKKELEAKKLQQEDAPTHNEMIEDLFIQLKKDVKTAGKDENDGSNIKELILAHRKKIDDVLEKNLEKLDSLYKERTMHISSSDMHTGWDRSFLNKGESTKEVKKTSETPAPVQTNSYSQLPETNSTKSVSEEPQSTSQITEDIGDLYPDTVTYSKLPIDNVDKIKKFLKSHTHIIKPDQKDSLLMKAFDAQFAGDDKKTYQIIYLSTLLQYILDIFQYKRTTHPTEIGLIIEQLLSKMFKDQTNPAYEAFKAENQRTFAHIKERCKILAQEQIDEEGIDEANQEIQLKSLDEDSTLVVNLPDPNSTDPEEKYRWESFQKLPKQMQDALKTESLDEVNKVFHGMPIPEAEGILEIFDECNVIGVQALIENEKEWDEIKDEYQKQQSQEHKVEELHDDEPEEETKIESLEINENNGNSYIDTADVVD